MSEFEVTTDRVYTLRTKNGTELHLSNSTDHAVRYTGVLSMFDHIVELTPLGIQTVNPETGEEGITEVQLAKRHFLGSGVVEQVVDLIGLHEVYATELYESVHEDYLDQQAKGLDDSWLEE